mgnify:CR=1 FL=1
MATNVTGGGPRKRGRPSKAELEARRLAAADASKIMSGEMKVGESANAKRTGLDTPAAGDQEKPAGGKATAPGLGHNAPDEGVFLRHLQAIRAHTEGPLAEAKQRLKDEKGKLKDIRQLAKADGLVLKELDEALEDAQTERVDLIAKEERRRLYRQWLGLPVGAQGELELDDRLPSIERERARWKSMGNVDGRLAKVRAAPEGCPPNMVQSYLEGWDAGQEALMRAGTLTSAAFKPAAPGSTAPAPALADTPAPESKPAEVPANGTTLILREANFEEGIELEDANRKTIVSDESRERFDAADTVVAVFGDKRRVLKEPAQGDEPAYVDTGEPDALLSDVEDAKPEEVTAAAEGDDFEASPEELARQQGRPSAEEEVVEDEDDGSEIPGEKPIESDKAEDFH